MNFEEQGNNKFRMTISDPELIEKIRESGIESLTPDDINSLGVEAKNGQLFFRDASAADPDSDNRIKLQSTENKRTGSSPLRRGLVGFIAIMVIVLIALSAVGIYLREKYLSSLAKEDIVFISLYAVVGLAIALSEFRTASAAKKYLTERVLGKCISLEYREKNGVRRPKKSIYEYTYKGETY